MFIHGAVAQDLIHKRNQEIIDCRVTEVGTDNVKYKLEEYGDEVVFSIETEQVLKVVFENGTEKYFTRSMDNPENYLDNKKHALKIDFMSPLTGNTTFAYERSLKPGASIEGTLGIIGIGFDPGDVNPAGAFLRFGYKFIKSPDFYFSRLRYSHILKGTYFKPEIAFGYYSQDVTEYNVPPGTPYAQTSRQGTFSGTIQLVIGKQWVINNAFLVDFFVGVGYGFDDGDGDYHYGYAIAPSEFPVSGSTGLKVGFLFD
jgi:hypothetical protein